MLFDMKTALGLVLGVSMLAMVGCDNGGDDGDTTGGVKPTGGSASTTAGSGNSTAGSSVVPSAGTGTGGTAGSGGDVTPAAGVPLTPAEGWVDGMSNTLGVQGAMFSYSDTTSAMGLVEDFVGDHACIKGTAAKVDLKCTPVAPATDCYGTFWGAAIGLNMNQPIDTATGEGAMPMPFDASAIKGFAFEIEGGMIPAPSAIRFKVEGNGGEFCNTSTKQLKAGENQFNFDELITACWKPVAGAANASSVKATVTKVAWQVVTNDKSTVPFDFCVKNVRALTE